MATEASARGLAGDASLPRARAPSKAAAPLAAKRGRGTKLEATLPPQCFLFFIRLTQLYYRMSYFKQEGHVRHKITRSSAAPNTRADMNNRLVARRFRPNHAEHVSTRLLSRYREHVTASLPPIFHLTSSGHARRNLILAPPTRPHFFFVGVFGPSRLRDADFERLRVRCEGGSP